MGSSVPSIPQHSADAFRGGSISRLFDPAVQGSVRSSDADRSSRLVAAAFGMIVVTGIVLRLLASVCSEGFVYADEHQQYLEVAQGLVYDYHVGFWEYEKGLRHYLYPGCLAGILYILDFVGLRDPLCQAMVIRGLLSISIFTALVLIVRDWIRARKVSAAFFIASPGCLQP